ncbi:hypothetical protein WJX82_007498 [Trebouxia sp. C0006]
MPSSADNGTAPVDWQLQQAAEALELEEFRALERQITQDSGMSAPSYARPSSRAQSVDQPQVDFYAEAQQAIPDSDFKHESAWDATQVAQGPAYNSDKASQDVRGGLQNTRASQSYIQGLFRQQQPIKPACETKMEDPTDTQAASIAALEQEMKDMQSERAKVSKLRTQLEQASTRMEQEKAAWERQKAEEAASWESEKEADSQRLKRHQRVLDKQSRALLKLPNRKERSEVEAVEAILEQERKAGHAKDARHKLTVERLRQKLVELQDTNAELREEIRFHEQRRLEEWNAKENQQPKANSKGRAAAADAPAATFAMGQALPQSAQAQVVPGSWASHSAVGYSGDRGPSSQVLNEDTGGAHDQHWARAGSMTAAQQGIAQSMQDHQQRSAGNEHLSSAGGASEKPYQELSYPDGKVEQIYLDGRRTVVFGNGTCKHQYPDGHTAIRFTNKDIKRFYPCGRVEYYYCEVDTWHTTHANGIEVFYFPNGQTEAHHPSGTKEIIFPDGVIRRVFTDGREQDVTPEQLSGPVKYPMPEDRD